MKEKAQNIGIAISGNGKLKSHNLVVGNDANISSTHITNFDPERVIHNLIDELSKLIEAMKLSNLESDKITAVLVARSELESESPNIFLAKSILAGVFSSIKNIGAIAGSMVSIQKLLDILN